MLCQERRERREGRREKKERGKKTEEKKEKRREFFFYSLLFSRSCILLRPLDAALGCQGSSEKYISLPHNTDTIDTVAAYCTYVLSLLSLSSFSLFFLSLSLSLLHSSASLSSLFSLLLFFSKRNKALNSEESALSILRFLKGFCLSPAAVRKEALETFFVPTDCSKELDMCLEVADLCVKSCGWASDCTVEQLRKVRNIRSPT